MTATKAQKAIPTVRRMVGNKKTYQYYFASNTKAHRIGVSLSIISNGKVIRSRTDRIKSTANQVFRKAVLGLANSKTALGAYYRRMRARIGKLQAKECKFKSLNLEKLHL